MKKIALVLVALLFSFTFSFAQTVQEQQVTMGKLPATAFTLKTMHSPAVMEGAIQQKLEKGMGLKASKYSGYKAFLAQQFPTISNQNLDVYFKSEEVGKKADKVTVVYMLVSTGNNNFITTANDAATAEKIKLYLADVVAYAAEYELEQNIINNTNNIKKLEGEQKKLESNKQKMQKQMNELEKQISDKQLEIDKLKEENAKLQQK